MGYRDFDITLRENLGDAMDGQPVAVRFQDLFFALPQRVDLRLFAVAAAPFRAASDLKKISSSRFEGFRISHWQNSLFFLLPLSLPCLLVHSCFLPKPYPT